MRYPRPRLARPVYESLPWLYMGGGFAALALSYRQIWPRFGLPLGLLGVIALLGGSVVWLRRRGYRRMRSHYVQPDALSDQHRESGD